MGSLGYQEKQSTVALVHIHIRHVGCICCARQLASPQPIYLPCQQMLTSPSPPVKTQPSFYTPPLQDYSSRGRSWSLVFGGAGGGGAGGAGGGSAFRTD